MQLLQQLVRKGVIQEHDRDLIAAAQKAARDKPIHQIILEKGLAKEEDVFPVLAEEFGMKLVDLHDAQIQPDVLKSFPSKLVHRRSLMPLSRENGTLVVATGNPFDVYALDELQTLTGLQVVPVLASPREISRLIKAHFGVRGETVTALMEERGDDGGELLEGLET